MQVGKGIKSGLETREWKVSWRMPWRRRGCTGAAFANVTSTDTEVRDGEMRRVLFKAAGCAGHRKLAAGSWCCSPIEERCSVLSLLPVGREELPEAAVPLVPFPSARMPPTSFPSWGLAFGAQGNSLMLFNANGADGYPSHPGLTCRKYSHEETTFGAIYSITSSQQPVQGCAPSPSHLLVNAEADVTPQPPACPSLPQGRPLLPTLPAPQGHGHTAGKVTCRS